MSAPSKQDACPISVEDKVSSMKEGNSAQAAELCCLSGDKPFFDFIFSKSHVTYPYRLDMPAHMAPILPRVNVHVVLTHGDKTWNASCIVKGKKSRFDSHWKNFVVDNNLKCEDACVFEVLESTDEILRLKVLILRDTAALPAELQAKIESRGRGAKIETRAAKFESRGKTPDTAIELD